MLTKIEIITRSTKLDDLLRALNRIGVMGITVSQVFGCGLSKGHQEIYRGQGLAQTHVHRISDAIQPSYPLSSPSPLAFNLSQHQGLFQ